MDVPTAESLNLIPCSDPSVWVIEFEGRETVSRSGKTYHHSYLCIIKTSAERIVHYKEYYDAITKLEALLDLEPYPAISKV